jgi:hypothetical protein
VVSVSSTVALTGLIRDDDVRLVDLWLLPVKEEDKDDEAEGTQARAKQSCVAQRTHAKAVVVRRIIVVYCSYLLSVLFYTGNDFREYYKCLRMQNTVASPLVLIVLFSLVSL